MRASTLLAAALLSVTLSAAPAPQPLSARLEAIRTAFVKNDPDGLARQFPPRDRVFVALPRLEPGAFLGPGPLRALLNRLTRETRTTEFTFVEPERAAAAATDESAYLKAQWTYRAADSDAPRSEELYLSLRRQAEDGEWRIVEIKAAR